MTDSASQTPASASVAEHRAAAPEAIRCAVLTVSDTRTEATDTSGGLIRKGLAERGHQVVAYRIVKDEPDQIRPLIEQWAADPTIQAIVTNGGTGIAARDTTYDVVSTLLEKRLDGFGELFRMLSYGEIGAAAMLSRAVAGVYRDTVVFVLPGSANAVGLALDKLILPEVAHVVFEIAKQQRRVE
jgi:molybdenum cofactor biosynthesis protein B